MRQSSNVKITVRNKIITTKFFIEILLFFKCA